MPERRRRENTDNEKNRSNSGMSARRHEASARDNTDGRNQPQQRDVIIAHSSDVHVDHQYTARLFGGDGAGGLRIVLAAARDSGADVVLLAGDTFDCHRLPESLLHQTSKALRDYGLPVVILPGNHDPAVDDAVFHHPAFVDVPGLSILGVTHDEAVLFGDLDLEVWGRAHRDYGDMDPLATARKRSTRWQIAMAHGHFTPVPDRSTRIRASWLIGEDELNATGADYVALGHWNRWVKVGEGPVHGYYSGSPDYARSINVVSLSQSKGTNVQRVALDLPPGFGELPSE